MKQKNRTGIVVMALCSAQLSLGGLPDAAGLTLTPADTPPVLDGTLDDACWQDAARIDTFRVIGAPEQTTQAHTARVTFDKAWLYVAFDVHHPESQRRPPVHLRHNGYIQRDDCVKVAFDPGTNGAVYYYFKLNPANARREQRNTRTRGQTTATQDIENWNIPWRSAVREHPEGWTAELAIPLSLLPPLDALGQARVNLLISRNVVTAHDETVQITEISREHLSAAPLEINFDEPHQFIPVTGLEGLAVEAPFLPYFEGVSAGDVRERDGSDSYDVSLRVTPFSAAPGRVRLEWEDIPEGAEPTIVSLEVDIPEGSDPVDVALPIPVEARGRRTGRLRMSDADTGEPWQSEPFTVPSRARQVRQVEAFEGDETGLSAYLDRSYYTDESYAHVIGEIRLPEAALKELRLIVTNEAGVIVASKEIPPDPAVGSRGRIRVPIPVERLATGTHALTVTLARPDGEAAYSQALELIKRPPNPGAEWKIDHENRLVLRNGKPFFVRGINVASGAMPRLEYIMQDIANMGFNAILLNNHPGDLDPEDTSYLDLAGQHGLWVMPWIEGYAEPDPAYRGSLVALHFALVRRAEYADWTFEERTEFWEAAVERATPRFLAAAKAVKRHPRFMGYFIFDEPVRKIKYDQISSGQRLYRQLHETDGYHPVMVNYAHLPEGDEYVDWCDILAVDPYWVPPGRPDRVSTFISQARHRGEPRRTPTYAVLCPEAWSFLHKRVISPRENLCQTYLALIHGAKGIWYFTYPLRWQFTADGFTRVNEHLDALEPMIMSPEIEQVFNEGGSPFPDVQAALFHNPDGGFVLLAANRCEYPVTATFNLSNLGDREEVLRLFDDDWSATSEQGSFSDRFEPFGVRAYVLPVSPAAAPSSAPVHISVRTQSHPHDVEPEPLVPSSGRLGKRNLLPNSGFEWTPTLPGAPDYYPLTGNIQHHGPRYGLPGAFVALCDENPFEGQTSLRIKCGPGARLNWVQFKIAPQVSTPTHFVFSVYMRADREGATAEFRSSLNPAEFRRAGHIPLSTEWERYHVSAEIQPGVHPATAATYIYLRAPPRDSEATIWVDALQFEQGTEPTEYEP